MINIRNFCIIAHIDHGKSTLADRFLEITGTIPERQMVEQVLDDMPLERERGITIKSHAIQMHYKAKDKNEYILNLIDTPGHVDFTYEVSRSLAACEGAVLVVDASQGVEAQTVSNAYMAIEAGLDIIPVINKIDLPSAMIDTVKAETINLLGCKEDEILLASAKASIGIDAILEAIVQRIPPPSGDPAAPLRALTFDSVFDPYRGSIVYLRVFEGTLEEKSRVMFFSNGKIFEAEEVGILELERVRTGKLSAGDVGYLIPGAKDVHDTKVGDTVTTASNPAKEPLPGYKLVKPMVFAGLYPSNSEEFEVLRDSLEKLRLNDSSLLFEPETSSALGFGFRCGFLGLLHMEIVQERLEREYNQ
ncbi:MAG: translation elongation factor 4, partial [Bacteroidota bacterium]